MLTLLKLIPLKDWLYLGLIVALFCGYGYWTHHERVIGRERCEAAVRAANDAAAEKVKALQARIDEQAANTDKALRDQLANIPMFHVPHVFDGCTVNRSQLDLLNKELGK